MAIAELVRRRRHRTPETPLDAFKGLVIGDEEVTKLVRDLTSGTPAESEPAAQAALRRIEDQLAARVRATVTAGGVYLPLLHLADAFRLTRFEERMLLVCLAPELDLRYEKLYAYLHDDVMRKKPTLGLALDVLCACAEERLASRAALSSRSALLEHHLCRFVKDAGEDSPDGTALLARPLKLDDRVVEFLLGIAGVDARIAPAVSVAPANAGSRCVVADETMRRRVRALAEAVTGENREDRSVVFCLYGPPGAGRRTLAEAVCCDLGVPLVIVDLERLAAVAVSFEEALARAGREALLARAAVRIDGLDSFTVELRKDRQRLEALLEAIRKYARIAFIVSRDAWRPEHVSAGMSFVTIRVDRPDARGGTALWKAHLAGAADVSDDVDFAMLSSEYRLGPGHIRQALLTARDIARWRGPDAGSVTTEDLSAACRAIATPHLGSLARRVDARQSWSDLVLPTDQLTQLRELCNHARHRHVVLHEWGFDRKLPLGRALSALFAGPPGTGKTMAAQVIAAELRRDLLQIDLSQIVSKYVGETEKNLRQVFDEADACHAILFFDEADALFGKRSEVKDAHDRYANVEIAYLLQRMEEYEGVAILATNLRHHLDDAFVRRIRFIVEFPFPDEAQRRLLWEASFPQEAPLAGDVDFAILARELRLAGGNIKNIALAAAFDAASRKAAISMSHLVDAARREHQKLGRTWSAPQSLRGRTQAEVS